MMSKRNAKIIRILLQHRQGITGEELSKLVGVSSRTIRSDIKMITAYLKAYGANLRSTTRSGYSLEIVNAELFSTIASERQEFGEMHLISAEQRVHYIMKKLLFNALENKQVTQMELADEMFVSISTLKIHLKETEKKLVKYGLHIGRYKTQGIWIVGDEAQVRYCISEYLFGSDRLNNFYLNDFYQQLFVSIDFKQLETIVLQVIASRSIKLTDMAIQNLLIHTAIAVKRAENQNYMVYTIGETKTIEAKVEFQVANAIVDELYQKLKINISASEVYYLAQHLIASKKYVDEDQEHMVILAELVESIIRKLHETLEIDFSDDDNLKKWLILHLKIAIPRMKFHMNIRNEVLTLIKNEYPLAFQIAVIASGVIEKAENIQVNENEIGYIAIHFGAALSRKGIRNDVNLKRALIVCATGIGMAVLLKAKLEEYFPNRLQVMRTVAGYELDEVSVAEADLILTTVPIPQIKSHKIIHIAHLLNQDEIELIEQRIFGKVSGKTAAIQDFFREDCFYCRSGLKSKQEVLWFLTEQMIDIGVMSVAMQQSVFDREAASSTEIGNLVAIPHSMHNDMDVSSIGVLILDKPVLWDEYQVQVVFLINITKEKFKLWETIFLKLFDYLVKENGVRCMVKDRSYKKFMESFGRKF